MLGSGAGVEWGRTDSRNPRDPRIEVDPPLPGPPLPDHHIEVELDPLELEPSNLNPLELDPIKMDLFDMELESGNTAFSITHIRV